MMRQQRLEERQEAGRVGPRALVDFGFSSKRNRELLEGLEQRGDMSCIKKCKNVILAVGWKIG